MKLSMRRMQTIWQWVKSLGYAIQPALFSVIVLVLGFIALAVIPQGKDAVLALADPEADWKRFFLVVTALVWAIQTWYWLRTLYILMDRDLGRNVAYIRGMGIYIPRILGLSTLLVVTFSVLRMAPLAYPSRTSLYWMAAVLTVISVLFFLFVMHRRKFKKLNLPELNSAIDRVNEQSKGKARNPRFADLHPTTRKTLLVFSGLAGLFLMLLIVDPHTFTLHGGVSVIILCIAIWVPAGSWILYGSMKYRLPIFTALLILSVLFRFWNDNHRVRLLEDQQPYQVSLEERMEAFLKKYQEGTGVNKMVVVSAEGGGIRSAYWTAAVLTRLDKLDPEFSRHVFAISGVSGGSLGASVYAALLKERQSGRVIDTVTAADQILKRDFLSPTITAMLCGDLVQRFLPYPIPFLCRARALERSWELSWAQVLPDSPNRFQQAFTSLWSDDPNCDIPLLFLNGTLVESGNRVIAAHTRIGRRFTEAVDIYRLTGNEMRLSTVVCGSARFPYISPAGTLTPDHHIVDGGYFDDSGAATTADILYEINKILTAGNHKVKVVVIQINNYLEPEDEIPRRSPLPFWELTAPLQTVFTVHRSRTDHAVNKLEKLSNAFGFRFIKFVPSEEKVEFPLGWTLSGEVRKRLARQAKKQVIARWAD